jgi:hypothetical protein
MYKSFSIQVLEIQGFELKAYRIIGNNSSILVQKFFRLVSCLQGVIVG